MSSAARYAAAVLALAALFSCAGAPRASDYASLVTISLDAVNAGLIQPDVAVFVFRERLENRGPGTIKLLSVERALTVDGERHDLEPTPSAIRAGDTLPALAESGSSLQTEIHLAPVPQSRMGSASQPEASWRLSSKLTLEDPRGNVFAVHAEKAGTLQRLISPALAIESITVRKMELINTRLKVDIVVRNENTFPLVLDAFDYALYGEGRFWARGRTAEEIVVDARSDKKIALELVMNFADMDRSVLDKVIYMKQVLCRLSGRIHLETGVDFLPAFDLPFSVEGEAPVAR